MNPEFRYEKRSRLTPEAPWEPTGYTEMFAAVNEWYGHAHTLIAAAQVLGEVIRVPLWEYRAVEIR